MKIYHLKTCDTCRKAIKALSAQAPELIEIRQSPPDRATVTAWLDRVGPEVLLNTRSTTWRGLPDAEKSKTPLDLLLAHPTLMKRPVILDGAQIHVGWSKAVQAAFGVG